jgi:hypothetical protein
MLASNGFPNPANSLQPQATGCQGRVMVAPALIEKLTPLKVALWGSRNAVLPVVGSGLSPGLASWRGLLERLIDELPGVEEQQEIRELLGNGKYLEVATYLEGHPAVGRPRVISKIEELFRQPKSPRPGIVDQLVRLPVDHFLTTNYDPWLKDALAERLHRAPRVYGPLDDGAFNDCSPASSPLVLMIHGDADRPQTCVLSDVGYRQLSHGHAPWRMGMQQLMGYRRLLFVGYSLSDPDIVGLLDEWQAVFAPHGSATRHFLLDAKIKISRRNLLRQRGVEPIEHDDHAQLAEVLDYLATPPAGHVTEVSSPGDEAIRAYVLGLLSDTSHIEIQGIGTRAGQGKSALRYPIEELYTPLRTREFSGPPGPPASRAAESPDIGAAAGLGERWVTLCEVLPRHRLLLIEGQPGAGKTTFLRLVACIAARDALGMPSKAGQSWSQQYLGLGEHDPALTPIFLRASTLVPLLEGLPKERRNERAVLAEWIEKLCCSNGAAVPSAQWSRLLEQGRALLLLDGVDEVASEALRVRLFAILRDASTHWKSRIVVSSRPFDTDAVGAMGFARVTVEPFGREEITQFVERWVRGLRGDDTGGTQTKTEQHQSELLEAILRSAQIRRLAENPVMLTCLCVVHFNEGKLPEGRARLYQTVVEWLLRARSDRRSNQGYNDEFARRAFARLALGMMATDQGKRSTVSFGEATKILCEDLKREFPKAPEDMLGRTGELWLEFECEASGVVQQLPGRQLRFWHLTFQEYLAALALSWQVAAGDTWWTKYVGPNLENAQWRETLDVLPGCLFDGPGIAAVDDLLKKVVEHTGGGKDLPSQARLAALLSRFLLPLHIHRYKPAAAIQSVYDRALADSMAIFTLQGAQQVPVETRIEVADALGRAGDPRLSPQVDNFIKLPGTHVSLGKYPVTVEEYQRFIDARGYEQSKYWSNQGWSEKSRSEWISPNEWEQQLEHPNCPVVSVSWYEAEAYCLWLSDQQGREIRLPTEVDWNSAATSPNGEYPWGSSEPNQELANFANDEGTPNVGHPTPVGIYPLGNGPLGHRDLAGNVWEWSADGHEDDKYRVLRGGSWGLYGGDVRSAVRSGDEPGLRGSGVGFRLARGQPSSSSK